jgi:hypothetical protein
MIPGHSPPTHQQALELELANVWRKYPRHLVKWPTSPPRDQSFAQPYANAPRPPAEQDNEGEKNDG